MNRRRPPALVGVALGIAIVAGCGSGDSATCLSNEIGRVCAQTADGSIRFSGSGLTPESEVLIDHPDLGPSTFTVDADGTFEPDGRGVLSLFADTPFTFTIAAIGADGQPIDGEITVRS